MRTTYTILLTGAIGISNLAGQAPAGNSGASSLNYFSAASTTADGGQARSASFKLSGTLGHVEANQARSKSYALTGGFVGALGARSFAPWLTSASPRRITPVTTQLVWLSGTRLGGGAPAVTIAGRKALVVANSQRSVAVRLPQKTPPGLHPITLQTSAGMTTLTQAIGVLPLVYTEGAAGSDVPFDLVFHGTRGDTVIWALGLRAGPPVAVGGFLHGFRIVSFAIVQPALDIQAPTGEVRIPVPASTYAFNFHVQAMFLTKNPGYAPGSFSNLLEF